MLSAIAGLADVRRERGAKVVEAPVGDLAETVEVDLHRAEAVQAARPRSVRLTDERNTRGGASEGRGRSRRSASMSARAGAGQVDDVRAVVLHARAGDRPALTLDLRPSHVGDIGDPLCGERQHADEGAIGRVRTGRLPSRSRQVRPAKARARGTAPWSPCRGPRRSPRGDVAAFARPVGEVGEGRT